MSSGPAATETAPRDPVSVPHLCVAPEAMCGGRSLTHLPHSLISATQPHASEERAMTHPPRRGETRSPPRSLAVRPPPRNLRPLGGRRPERVTHSPFISAVFRRTTPNPALRLPLHINCTGGGGAPNRSPAGITRSPYAILATDVSNSRLMRS